MKGMIGRKIEEKGGEESIAELERKRGGKMVQAELERMTFRGPKKDGKLSHDRKGRKGNGKERKKRRSRKSVGGKVGFFFLFSDFDSFLYLYFIWRE